MQQQITCSDSECKFYDAGNCTADTISHTSDRFCVTGRRRPRDETAELMQQFKPGCRPSQRGYKADHGKTYK